ncbi:kelch-like protein 33 [Lissotriton helveticus]
MMGSSDSDKKLQSKEYLDTFFSNMSRLREDGLLVDLFVTTGGTLYNIHGFILAAVSSYFYTLMEEKKPLYTVDLEGKITVRGWQAILDFAYHGTVQLHKTSTDEILLAAEFLQVPRLVAVCMRFKNPSPPKTQHMTTAEVDEKCETLRGIQDLYKKGIGCDVHLQVNDITFLVHRAALAAGSDFFHGMLMSGMREAKQETIELKTLSVADLRLFIDFIYSGIIQVNWDSIFETTEAAMKYQMQSMLTLCFQFLREEMSPEFSLDVMSLAEAYGLQDLKSFTDEFILRNFKQVVAVPKYQDLTADQLVTFLSKDALYTTTELEVFLSVVQWINTDRKQRLSQAARVMKCVRFPLMTNREMRQIIAVDLMAPSGRCYGVLEASLLSDPRGPSVMSQLPCRVRFPDKVLVLIGGDSLNDDLSNRKPSKELWFAHKFITGIGLVKYIEWRKLISLPEMPRFRHGAITLDNNIYVFGGNFYYGKQDVLKTAIRYSPQENAWETLAEMKECHSYFPLVCLDGLIYILGGNTDITNADCLNSVECYNPANNSWKYAHPLPQPLCGHDAAVCDGKIYVSGGCDSSYQCLNSFFLYDPVKNATYLSAMNAIRAGHVMETIREKLYVAGGLGHSVQGFEDQYMCEVYSPATDCWTQFARLTQAHVAAASSVLHDELYILGGYSYETYRDSHLVHCYNPVTDRWVNLGTMPYPSADIKACILSLPYHQRHISPVHPPNIARADTAVASKSCSAR